MNGRDAQARRALDVERIDLRDGSILFKFKVQNEPAVSAEEERLLAKEEAIEEQTMQLQMRREAQEKTMLAQIEARPSIHT